MKANIDVNITERAKAMLEKPLTPDEALVFLKDESNFRSPANGIPTWFAKYHPEIKENKVAAAFVKRMKELFNKDESDTRKWLRGERMPDRDSAIKILFALDLPKKTAMAEANDFLFKVCKWNGFNFRCVEDIVVCYALENGLPYAEVEAIIDEYLSLAVDEAAPKITNATKCTRHLENLFSALGTMARDVFIKRLCENKHNFLGYGTTAQRLFIELHNSLFSRIEDMIQAYEKDPIQQIVPREKHMKVDFRHEIISDNLVNAVIMLKEKRKVAWQNKSSLEEIIRSFPRNEYISEMMKNTKRAFDAGYSRKTYMLLFFANEVFMQEDAFINSGSSIGFFKRFYTKLNIALLDCGYGLIHPANPYDWIILNCVRSLDNENTDYLEDPLQLFNDLLHIYIEE